MEHGVKAYAATECRGDFGDDLLCDVHVDVVAHEARLERESQEAGLNIPEEDKFTRFTAEGDTANVWRDRPLFVVKSQAMDNLQTWEQECDSTWQPGDDVLWRFNTMKITRNYHVDIYADLVIIYTNDSVRSQLLSVGGRENAEGSTGRSARSAKAP